MKKAKMLVGTLCALALLAGLAILAAPALAEGYAAQKVVYHFNTSDPKINGAGLKNIENHLNAVGQDKLTVVALVHSAAWEMVAKAKADPTQVAKMKALIERGVAFKICKNTLHDKDLNPETDLAIPMTVVPAGVAELVKLQQEGFAYIKP